MSPFAVFSIFCMGGSSVFFNHLPAGLPNAISVRFLPGSALRECGSVPNELMSHLSSLPNPKSGHIDMFKKAQ